MNINGVTYMATPMTFEEEELVFALGFIFRGFLYPSNDPGVYIIGEGYTRWISNSWYEDEEIERL